MMNLEWPKYILVQYKHIPVLWVEALFELKYIVIAEDRHYYSEKLYLYVQTERHLMKRKCTRAPV